MITNAAQEAAEAAAKRDAEREAEKARTVEPLERASATPTNVKQEPLGVGPVLRRTLQLMMHKKLLRTLPSAMRNGRNGKWRKLVSWHCSNGK